MEMEPWLQTLLTILGTILASSGFWAYIAKRIMMEVNKLPIHKSTYTYKGENGMQV